MTPQFVGARIIFGSKSTKNCAFLKNLWKFQMFLISECVLKPRIMFGWTYTNWKVTNGYFKTETTNGFWNLGCCIISRQCSMNYSFDISDCIIWYSNRNMVMNFLRSSSFLLKICLHPFLSSTLSYVFWQKSHLPDPTILIWKINFFSFLRISFAM